MVFAVCSCAASQWGWHFAPGESRSSEGSVRTTNVSDWCRCGSGDDVTDPPHWVSRMLRVLRYGERRHALRVALAVKPPTFATGPVSCPNIAEHTPCSFAARPVHYPRIIDFMAFRLPGCTCSSFIVAMKCWSRAVCDFRALPLFSDPLRPHKLWERYPPSRHPMCLAARFGVRGHFVSFDAVP